MSTDIVKDNRKDGLDISWEVVIQDAEEQLRLAQCKVKELSESLRFFKQKKRKGEPFPGHD
jgi:hypothetical protein